MIINHITFEFYAFLEFFWLWSENLGISASKRSCHKNYHFEAQIHIFSYFLWKVGARIIIIAVLQKYGEKSEYFGWLMAFFKGGHIVPLTLKLRPEVPRH